jgi:hypothetical protein
MDMEKLQTFVEPVIKFSRRIEGVTSYVVEPMRRWVGALLRILKQGALSLIMRRKGSHILIGFVQIGRDLTS